MGTSEMTTRPVDRRPALTVKGEEITPEFRALINKAAKKLGKTQAVYLVDTMTRDAQRVLKGEEEQGTTEALPPALLNTFRKEVDRCMAEVTAATRQEAAEVAAATRQEMTELREQMADMADRIAAGLATQNAGNTRPGILGRLFKM